MTTAQRVADKLRAVRDIMTELDEIWYLQHEDIIELEVIVSIVYEQDKSLGNTLRCNRIRSSPLLQLERLDLDTSEFGKRTGPTAAMVQSRLFHILRPTAKSHSLHIMF